MTTLTVQVNYALQGRAPETLKFSIEVNQEQMEYFFPPMSPGESGGWPYWKQTVGLIAPILKKKLFPDETTPVESVDDFRRLGVSHLQFFIRNSQHDTLSMPLIIGTPEQLP